MPGEKSEGDELLMRALEKVDEMLFGEAKDLVNEAIEKGISWDVGRAEAHNLRGTFR